MKLFLCALLVAFVVGCSTTRHQGSCCVAGAKCCETAGECCKK